MRDSGCQTIMINHKYSKLLSLKLQIIQIKSIQIINLMFEYIILAIFLATAFVFYRFYYVPKAEIKRYKTILQNLGYKVYEQPFSFLGLSFVEDYERGKRDHKDAEYFERTVYSQIDVSVGHIFNSPLIYLVNPDLIKEFSTAQAVSIYPKNQMLVAGTKAVFGEGLVFSEGDTWKNKRKLLSKVFNFELIKENIGKMGEICDQCFDIFDAKNQIGQGKFKYNVLNVSARIFNRLMMKCFFGSSHINDEVMGLKYQQFVVMTVSKAAQLTLNPILTFLGKFAWNIGMTSNIRHVKQCIRLMRAKASEVLKKRTEEVKNSPRTSKITDIIQALAYQKMDNKEQFQYSDKDLIDEFQTFSIAGTDTTTRLFTMIVYYMGKYPHIQQKLRDHIDSIIKTDQDITYENLKKLTYIDWIQFETTRHYGPANGIFWRTASQDNKIKDIPISKGTIVSTQPKGSHYNPKYFKDPTVFRPERWESQCDNIHPYAFIGFSAGPRNCIGKQLAHLQSKIALVKLIRRYKTIEVPDELTMNITFLYEAEPFDTTFTK